jgi:hypothetical protein
MTGQLITFSVRLYARGARVLVHAAEDVTGKAVIGTLRLAGALGSIRPGSGGAGSSAPPRPPAAAERRGATAPPVPGPSSSAAPEGATARPCPSAQDPAGRRNGSTATGPRPTRPQPTPAATPAPDLPEPDPRIASRARRDAVPAEPPPAAATGSDAGTPLASDRLEQDGVVAPIDLETPALGAPDHVSADAVVVHEEAEAGAQDGAGASISVQEPWDGYGKLNARDVVARLAASSTAELAAVQLYESAHRKRQTVITAVARELAKPQR